MAENHALITEAMYTQDVKEKDSSKNLVSGDFEKQYTERMMEGGVRRGRVLVVLCVCVGALAAWLLAVTVVREVQLARLRHQVDELSANMIAITANLKNLNQKISNNRLFNEFKTLEDTIYADEDEAPVMGKQHDSLEKLHDLTVLEDESTIDDEDAYDGDGDYDDPESGDWYTDYDNRRQKVGTTNMVHLKPEDFTDTVLTLEKEKKELPSSIKETMRLLNENPENPNIDLSMLKIQSSKTAKESDAGAARNKRSVLPDSTPVIVDHQYAPPSSIAKADDRRKTKKYTPSADSLSSLSTLTSKMPLHTVTRRSDDEGSQRRPFIAAHFHGNTSHLNTKIHEHYKGNGLVRLAHGAAHDVWYPAPWTAASPHPRPTLTRNGHVHVHHTGVYLVYVQIYYLDSHDIISWVLHRTNAEIEGRETILQCAQSSHSTDVIDKPNSCFSASALFLKAGDRLAVRNTGGDRHSLMEPEKSFIGLIKLADADDPNDEEF